MGETVEICRVHGVGELLNRLLALGFTPGATVRPELRAPLGDPTVYRLRGYAVALGHAQAKLMEVRPRRIMPLLKAGPAPE